jgi:fructosamine-3-kinase
MDPALERGLTVALGSKVARSMPLSGGDINQAYRVTLGDGRVVFVKANPRLPASVFDAEARGLAWLREANALRVPEVIAIASDGDQPAFLVLEMLESAERRRDFDDALGRGLAKLHRAAPNGFGLAYDNAIGALPQDNTPSPDWASFYRDRRLAPQLERAVRSGLLDAATERAFESVFSRLDELSGPKEAPARLHGDLWSGNLHAGPEGQPCLIDPACYGGHREMDLAMMRLFGGFGARTFAAYDETFPLCPGHEKRVPLYQLYPLLVHVNLFGGGYVGSLERALQKLR